MQSGNLNKAICCALILSTVLVTLKIANAPLFTWNGLRVTPSVALVQGKLIVAPLGQAPLTSGQTGALVTYFYAPSALFSSPHTVIWAAVSRAVLFSLFGALFLLGSGTALSLWEYTLGGSLFCLLALKSKALWLSLFMIHSDAVAIGFCALSLALLMRSPHSSRLRLVLVFILATLSVFSKVTFAPVFLSTLAFIFLRDGIRKALDALGMASTIFLTIAGVLILRYGWKTVFQYSVGIKINWVKSLSVSEPEFATTFPQKLKVFLSALLELNNEYLFLICLAILAIFALHTSLKKSVLAPWFLPLLTAVLMIPTALIGRVKAGGDFNTQSPTVFFFLIAVTQLALECVRRFYTARMVVAAALYLLCFYHVTTLYSLVWPLKDLSFSRATQAFEAAKLHPEMIYFPEFPLSSLLAEKKIYHSGAAVDEYWHLAPEIVKKVFHTYLPKNMRYLAFQGAANPVLRQLLPEFSKRAEISGLQNWLIFTR